MATYMVKISGSFSYQFELEVDDDELPEDDMSRDDYLNDLAEKEYTDLHSKAENLGDCIDTIEDWAVEDINDVE